MKTRRHAITDLNKELGASLVEYALLVACIVTIGTASVRLFGDSVSEKFSNTGSVVLAAGGDFCAGGGEGCGHDGAGAGDGSGSGSGGGGGGSNND